MFTQTPNNLSSLYSELIYSYTSSSTGDKTLQIYEDETDELLGVKKFYSTNTAQLNITPHIRPYAMPTIDYYSTGFITPYRNCNVVVYVKAVEDNSYSTPRQFTLSRGGIDGVGVVSSLPMQRTISDGESEQIYISAEAGDQISIVERRYVSDASDSYERPYLSGEFSHTLDSSVTYGSTVSDGQIEIFNFVASSNKSSEGQIEKIELVISRNSEEIGTVVYNVVESTEESVRLAWISDSGSIEHYTFPIVKESVMDDESGLSVKLTSAFEGYATRVALSQIVRSPMVWMFGDGFYEEVSVVDSELSVASLSYLGTVDITIACND